METNRPDGVSDYTDWLAEKAPEGSVGPWPPEQPMMSATSRNRGGNRPRRSS